MDVFVLRIIRPGRLDLSLGCWHAGWVISSEDPSGVPSSGRINGVGSVLGNSADEELSADLAGSGSVVATFDLAGQKSNFLR